MKTRKFPSKFKLPQKLRKTVLFQLIIYFVLIITITLCASSYFTFTYFSSYFKTEITQINRKVLNQLSVFTDDFILDNVNMLVFNMINNSDNNYIKEFIKTKSYNSGYLLNLKDQLNNLVDQNSGIVDSIMIYSMNSKILEGTKFIKHIDPETAKESQEFNWISTFLTSGKKLLWLKTRNTTVYSDSTKMHGDVITLICSYPLASTGKDIEGCVALNIKEQALNSYLVKFNSLNKGNLIIIDNTGAIISNSDNTRLYKDISNESFVKHIIGNIKNPDSFVANYDGSEYVISYVPSSFNSWIYISMVPTAFFYQQDYLIKKNLIIVSLIILLIVFIFSNLLSYKLYAPLRKVIDRYLAENTGSIGTGQNINEYKLLDILYSNLSNKINDLQGTLDKNSLIIRHNLLMGLLTSQYADPFDYNDYLKFLNITFENRYFMVFVFTINKELVLTTQAENLLFIKYKVIDFINSKNQVNSVFQTIETDLSTIAVIMNSNSLDQNEINGFIADVMDFYFSYFSSYPTVGVGNAYEDIGLIKKSYIEAKISIQYRFLYSEQNVFFYENASKSAPEENIETLKGIEAEVNKYIKLENMDKMEQTLRKLPNIIAEKRIPYIQAKRAVLNIIGILRAYASDKNINLEEVLGDASLVRLRNAESIYCFIDTFIQYINSIYNHLSNKKLNKNTELVNDVKQYIANNIHMDISLNSTAEAFLISPFYLSKIFKEETSYNYIDYVVNCKMNKAKELLSSTNMELEKITALIGYRQASYFSRKFKESTGMTPIEYRKRRY